MYRRCKIVHDYKHLFFINVYQTEDQTQIFRLNNQTFKNTTYFSHFLIHKYQVYCEKVEILTLSKEW